MAAGGQGEAGLAPTRGLRLLPLARYPQPPTRNRSRQTHRNLLVGARLASPCQRDENLPSPTNTANIEEAIADRSRADPRWRPAVRARQASPLQEDCACCLWPATPNRQRETAPV